jgi:hypothetical protein
MLIVLCLSNYTNKHFLLEEYQPTALLFFLQAVACGKNNMQNYVIFFYIVQTGR